MNVVSVKTENDIIKQLHFVAIALLVGCLVYSINLSLEGVDWFVRQTAFDTPGWGVTDKDAYWKKFAELVPGGDEYRGFYNLGPTNGFMSDINRLSLDQVKTLYQAGGVSYMVEPLELGCMIAGLIVQIGLLRLLRRRVPE